MFFFFNFGFGSFGGGAAAQQTPPGCASDTFHSLKNVFSLLNFMLFRSSLPQGIVYKSGLCFKCPSYKFAQSNKGLANQLGT